MAEKISESSNRKCWTQEMKESDVLEARKIENIALVDVHHSFR